MSRCRLHQRALPIRHRVVAVAAIASGKQPEHGFIAAHWRKHQVSSNHNGARGRVRIVENLACGSGCDASRHDSAKRRIKQRLSGARHAQRRPTAAQRFADFGECAGDEAFRRGTKRHFARKRMQQMQFLPRSAQPRARIDADQALAFAARERRNQASQSLHRSAFPRSVGRQNGPGDARVDTRAVRKLIDGFAVNRIAQQRDRREASARERSLNRQRKHDEADAWFQRILRGGRRNRPPRRSACDQRARHRACTQRAENVRHRPRKRISIIGIDRHQHNIRLAQSAIQLLKRMGGGDQFHAA